MRFLVYALVGFVAWVLAIVLHSAGHIGVAWVVGFPAIAVAVTRAIMGSPRNRQPSPD